MKSYPLFFPCKSIVYCMGKVIQDKMSELTFPIVVYLENNEAKSIQTALSFIICSKLVEFRSMYSIMAMNYLIASKQESYITPTFDVYHCKFHLVYILNSS